MVYDLGYHAGSEVPERFDFGRFPSDSWEPDETFRKEMTLLAKETGTEIIDLDRVCRDAYGWYWSDFEEMAANDKAFVTNLIEDMDYNSNEKWSDEDWKTYIYLKKLEEQFQE